MRPAIFSLRWGTLKDPFFFKCTAVDPAKNCGIQSLTIPLVGSCQNLSLLCNLEFLRNILCSFLHLHPHAKNAFSELAAK